MRVLLSEIQLLLAPDCALKAPDLEQRKGLQHGPCRTDSVILFYHDLSDCMKSQENLAQALKRKGAQKGLGEWKTDGWTDGCIHGWEDR